VLWPGQDLPEPLGRHRHEDLALDAIGHCHETPSLPLDNVLPQGCEREVDEVEWQGGRVYLHLGVRRANSRQR
jgi:hypothetical protein